MWPELRSKVYIKLSELISFMDSRCLIEQSLGHAQTTRRLDAVASHEYFRYLPWTDINLGQAMENEIYLYFKKSFRLFCFHLLLPNTAHIHDTEFLFILYSGRN